MKCAWYLHCIPSPKPTVLPVTTLKNRFSLFSVIFPELSTTRTSDNSNFFWRTSLRVIGNRPYTVISRKVVGKNVHVTIPKGNLGYDQYVVPNDCSCRTYFCCFPLALANITSQTSRAILSNFFEEQCRSKLLKIPFGIVARSFSDNLSRNSCILKYGFNLVNLSLRCSCRCM